MSYVVHATYLITGIAVHKQWLAQRFASLRDVQRFARDDAADYLRDKAPSARTGAVYVVKRYLASPRPRAVFMTNTRGTVERLTTPELKGSLWNSV